MQNKIYLKFLQEHRLIFQVIAENLSSDSSGENAESVECKNVYVSVQDELSKLKNGISEGSEHADTQSEISFSLEEMGEKLSEQEKIVFRAGLAELSPEQKAAMGKFFVGLARKGIEAAKDNMPFLRSLDQASLHASFTKGMASGLLEKSMRTEDEGGSTHPMFEWVDSAVTDYCLSLTEKELTAARSAIRQFMNVVQKYLKEHPDVQASLSEHREANRSIKQRATQVLTGGWGEYIKSDEYSEHVLRRRNEQIDTLPSILNEYGDKEHMRITLAKNDETEENEERNYVEASIRMREECAWDADTLIRAVKQIDKSIHMKKVKNLLRPPYVLIENISPSDLKKTLLHLRALKMNEDEEILIKNVGETGIIESITGVKVDK